MNTNKEQDARKFDAQELDEQELEQVSGAGADDSFLCACGSTEFDSKREYNSFYGTRFYKECKNCHKKYYSGYRK